jgi:hypothetical protein
MELIPLCRASLPEAGENLSVELKRIIYIVDLKHHLNLSPQKEH